MLKMMALAALFLTGDPATAAKCEAEDGFAMIVHGGTARAGTFPAERTDFLHELMAEMNAELQSGMPAVDAVEQAVRRMEDSGLFNAGKGAIANEAGFVETDASIMDGASMEAGSVASMRYIKNPIRAARIVMDETRHVMMVGDRGEQAVTERGAETVPADYFRNNRTQEPEEHGTVGAAVLDRCGNLAAGTSTGGYNAKIPGRVGDSPVIGAGTYAKNGIMAASGTGHGEFYIRFSAMRTIAARMEYGGQNIVAATRAVLREMAAAGDGSSGRGGIIGVDAAGNFSHERTYDGMVWASTRNGDEIITVTGVFDDTDERTH